MTKKWQISRRMMLRGVGTAVALPLLDAMGPATSLAARAATGSVAPPKRMAFIFIPNGVNLPEWTPKQTGYDYDLPFILQPLKKVKDDVMVLSGLTHDKGRANGDGPGDHARSASVFLSGCQPRKTAGANIHVGTSVDQIAAQRIGNATKFPSLELGCESGRNSGNCDSGYSYAYSHNISWASPTTPVAKKTDDLCQLHERPFPQGGSLGFRGEGVRYDGICSLAHLPDPHQAQFAHEKFCQQTLQGHDGAVTHLAGHFYRRRHQGL